EARPPCGLQVRRSRAGTYSRFGGYVKGAGSEISRAAPVIIGRGFVNRLPPDLSRLVRRARGRRPAARAVGQAQDRVVRPDVGLERAATFELRLVAREAQLVVAEHR